MRVFYASFLSSENMRAYEELVAGAMGAVPHALRPVPTGTQHLTIAFLGDIAEGEVETYLEILAAVKDLEAIPFTLDEPSILYSRQTPRLVKAKLREGAERISRLQELIKRKLREYRPESVVRMQPPHVTLARFRKNVRRETARRVADWLARQDDASLPESDTLQRVELVRSTLTPQGPIYETVARTELAGEADPAVSPGPDGA
jgi:2'-5' RNA ligase